MISGSEAIWLVALIMWGIAFIKEPKYQRYFYQSSCWLALISWVNALWVNIAFLVGGLTEDTADWSNLYYPLTYDVLTATWQLIIYFVLKPKLVKFYRWDEQDWWKEEGDFEESEMNEM